MPQSGTAVDGQINSFEPSPGVVGETLIFSPDLIKTDSFDPEDHVILVVPDSSDNLVADSQDTDETQYITMPGSPVQDENTTITVDPSQFSDPLSPNFLFITKLVHPTKLSPGLVPIVDKPEPTPNATVVPSNDDKSSVKEQVTSCRTDTGSVGKPQKLQKTPKNLGKCHGSKQEAPEIFGKLFPASFNEVLFKKIRDIVVSKKGPDTNDDTNVPEEIVCPHCRKQQLTLNCLREHLYNCHTYVNKRKMFSPVRNRPKRPLHRCADCKALFISSERMKNHDCRRPNQIFDDVGGLVHQNGTEKMAFGSDRSETATAAVAKVRSSNDDDPKMCGTSAELSRESDCPPLNPSTASRPDTDCRNPTTIVEETSKCLGCRAVLTGDFHICDKCLANAEIKGDTIILECEWLNRV